MLELLTIGGIALLLGWIVKGGQTTNMNNQRQPPTIQRHPDCPDADEILRRERDSHDPWRINQ